MCVFVCNLAPVLKVSGHSDEGVVRQRELWLLIKMSFKPLFSIDA